MKLLPLATVAVVAAAALSYQAVQTGGGPASCEPVTVETAVLFAAETTGSAVHSLTQGAPPSEVVAEQTLGTMDVLGTWTAGFVAAVRGEERPESVTRYEAQAVSVHRASTAACQPCSATGVQPASVPAGEGRTVAEAAAAAAGFTGEDLAIAVAVAGAESGWRNVDNAGTNRNGTVDYGMWQINTVHADLLAADDWRDPAANARMAHAVWERAGRSWTPWVTFNNGAYREHLGTTGGSTHAVTAATCAPGSARVVTAATGPAPAAGSFIIPTPGRASSEFGYRIHPVYGERKLHKGLDIATSCGTPVKAAQAGTVQAAQVQGSYGQIVVVEHGDGLSTAYAHLEAMSVVPGERVAQGQQVGRVGTAGTSTGCHLHYEVREHGQPVNPRAYRPAGV